MDNGKRFVATVLPATAVFVSGIVLIKAVSQPEPQAWRIILVVAGFLLFLLMFIFSRPFVKKGKPS